MVIFKSCNEKKNHSFVFQHPPLSKCEFKFAADKSYNALSKACLSNSKQCGSDPKSNWTS